MIDPMINNKLVTAEQLLELLFTPEAKPSLRWLRNQTKAKSIPFVKIGHLVFFEPDMVRETLKNRFLVRSRYELKAAAKRAATVSTTALAA